MPPPAIQSPRELPPWVVPVGSLIIILHFLAVGTLVLSASSGPWSTPFGESPAMGPKFAELANDVFTPYYLEPLRLTHNYHYTDNRLMVSAVYFEARIKDAQGVVVKTVKFPRSKDNFWLQHRYKLLALGLGNDQPIQPPRGEVIPAPGAKMPKVTFWDNSDVKLWKLKTEEEHLIPKDRPVMRPSEWSLLLARAYQRYLLRENKDAASVELIRHSRDQVLPDYMYLENAPPNTFDELVCSFGDYRREK